MHALLVCHDAGGTIPPVLALTEALVGRGHSVTVLSQPSVHRRAAAAGARFVPFSHLGDYDRHCPLEEQLDRIGAAIVGREVGDDLLGILADVVVVDANLAGALAAAETLDLPTAVLLHSVYASYTDVWFASLWPLLGAAICDTRRAFGLGMVDGWPEVFAGHDRLLAVVPSVFDPPPSSAVVPPTVRRFGFLVPRSVPAGAGDVVAFPEGAGPCVLVSLGTTSQGQAAALERIVDELSSMPVRAVVTTAGQAPELASTANVTVVDFVPHAALLPAADVVVTHAGLGTVAAALDAGVPLVCVPFDRDQPLNAARVAELGAGVVASVDDVGSAVSRVLGDSSFRERAAWLADASRAEGGADAAALELESLL